MKDFLKLIVSITGSELVGLAGTPFTIGAIATWYVTLSKPFFAPPNWIFGPVWTLLYLMIGISFYLIWRKGWKKRESRIAGKIFISQLLLNLVWSPLFFGLRSPLLGLVDIVLMWLFIMLTIRSFYPLSKWASYLLVPYFLWVSFATILNAAIFIMN